MTLPAVRFLPEALEELLETQHWYGTREPALANDFAQTVAAAVERIRHSPQSFPLIHGRSSCLNGDVPGIGRASS